MQDQSSVIPFKTDSSTSTSTGTTFTGSTFTGSTSTGSPSGGGAGSVAASVVAQAVAGIQSAAITGGAVQYEIPVTGKSGVAVRFPAVPIQPGATVDVVPLPSNTAIVYVAQGLTEVATGPRVPLAATSNPRSYAINNLAQLFLLTQADGEGVLATVRKANR